MKEWNRKSVSMFVGKVMNMVKEEVSDNGVYDLKSFDHAVEIRYEMENKMLETENEIYSKMAEADDGSDKE